MGDWLHRITKQHLRSISPASLPESKANYISTPNLSAVVGFPVKYWMITGDAVTLMDKAARDAVDGVEVAVGRDSVVGQLDRTEDLLRAFAMVVMDEINILRVAGALPPREWPQLKNAMRQKLGS